MQQIPQLSAAPQVIPGPQKSQKTASPIAKSYKNQQVM